ncbi:MAG: class I SAM-dependent methyltransferase [Treponema sp.]|nr:class I SAM-dependent methyltransferase [Treponema sp.]
MIKTWSTPVNSVICRVIPCAVCGSINFKPALKCENFLYVRCSNCGLVQMNPQPEKSGVLNRYSKIYGDDYLAYETANEEPFLKLQQLALNDAHFFDYEKLLFANNNEPPSALDAGCATGTLLDYLRGRGWRVTGIEISPCADYGRKTRKLDIRNVPLEDCHFDSGCFDTVFASHIIEHLNDPFGFICEVRRILKNGGFLFITTPNIYSFQSCLLGSRWRSAIFDHLYLFSKKTLKLLLKKAGFLVKELHTWGGLAEGLAPSVIKKIFDKLAKHFGFGDVMIIKAEK